MLGGSPVDINTTGNLSRGVMNAKCVWGICGVAWPIVNDSLEDSFRIVFFGRINRIGTVEDSTERCWKNHKRYRWTWLESCFLQRSIDSSREILRESHGFARDLQKYFAIPGSCRGARDAQESQWSLNNLRQSLINPKEFWNYPQKKPLVLIVWLNPLE